MYRCASGNAVSGVVRLFTRITAVTNLPSLARSADRMSPLASAGIWLGASPNVRSTLESPALSVTMLQTGGTGFGLGFALCPAALASPLTATAMASPAMTTARARMVPPRVATSLVLACFFDAEGPAPARPLAFADRYGGADMQLSMGIGYSGGHKKSAALVRDLEKAGLDVAWVAEAYSFDAPSYMGYLAAVTERVQIAAGILPIYSRTPTLLAMTAAGVDALSDGRCILGLGASGPQVIEGFHGVAYDRPIGRTREII